MSDLPLIQRKQRQARQRIVTAAHELFADRGFAGVSVDDIAHRAEVGRTTFFRYFGDKQEVVFAREQELLDLIAAEPVRIPESENRTASSALRALAPIMLDLSERMTADRDDYRRHLELVGAHAELTARYASKMQVVAVRLGDLLQSHGWSAFDATLGAEMALACFWTAHRLSPDPGHLVGALRRAFREAGATG